MKNPKKITPPPTTPQRQMRGFAVMSKRKRVEIARQGGLAISRDRKYMANLGRLGGLNSHKNTNPKED